MTLTNSTVSNNSASGSPANGGGISNSFILTIKNSIVVNSPAGGDCRNNTVGTFTALGKNFDTGGTGAALDPDFMQVRPAQLKLAMTID